MITSEYDRRISAFEIPVIRIMNLHPDGHRPSGCFFDSPGASHGIKIEMYLFDNAEP